MEGAVTALQAAQRGKEARVEARARQVGGPAQAPAEVRHGPGRSAAPHYRPSALHRIHGENRRLLFAEAALPPNHRCTTAAPRSCRACW